MISKKFDKNFYKYLKNPHDLIIEIAIRTGLRISDVLNLKVNQIKVAQPYILERKSKKTRRIFLSKKLRTNLEFYALQQKRKDADFIFMNDKTGKPYTRQAVYKAVKKAAAEVYGTKKHYSPHSARKTYVFSKQNSGMTISNIQKKLNHDNLATTLIYINSDKLASDQDKEMKKNAKKGRKKNT